MHIFINTPLIYNLQFSESICSGCTRPSFLVITLEIAILFVWPLNWMVMSRNDKRGVSAFLKSDFFKDIVRAVITEAMNVSLAQYVQPVQGGSKMFKRTCS